MISVSPSSFDRSARSVALAWPPRISLAVAESHRAAAGWVPHRSRAWANDWRTTMVAMPVPPPWLISPGQGALIGVVGRLIEDQP